MTLANLNSLISKGYEAKEIGTEMYKHRFNPYTTKQGCISAVKRHIKSQNVPERANRVYYALNRKLRSKKRSDLPPPPEDFNIDSFPEEIIDETLLTFRELNPLPPDTWRQTTGCIITLKCEDESPKFVSALDEGEENFTFHQFTQLFTTDKKSPSRLKVSKPNFHDLQEFMERRHNLIYELHTIVEVLQLAIFDYRNRDNYRLLNHRSEPFT